MRASTLWKQPRTWIVVLIGSLLAALSTVSYLGPSSDPDDQLRNLPLVLVAEDEGSTGPHGSVNLGRELADGIARAAQKDGRVRWSLVTSREDAWRVLDGQEAYAALVVPRDFTGRALSLLGTGTPARRPVMEIVVPRGVSGMAASMADKAVRRTVAEASRRLGAQLVAETSSRDGGTGTSRAKGAQPKEAVVPGGFLALLDDPVEVTAVVRQPSTGPVGSGAGAAPLYIAIALLISGLLPATLLTTLIDAGLGYLPLEVGPRRKLRPVVRIARSSTFLAKAVLGAVMGCAAGAVVAGVSLWSTDFQPDDTGLFVLFCSTVCAAVALLTLALFAVFGAPGQVLALFAVTLVGVPLSAGALPVEALPGGFDTLGRALPARHAVEGVRSLLFFDGAGDRVRQAWWVLGAYAVGAAVIGWAVCRWYDRRGYHRAQEHEFQPPRAAEPVALPLSTGAGT
ncbi:YhgE/Pip domain-containing protein [Streptomyces sp. NPDC006463]|uniref:YhgE/Pip domain-containing protein n=1 Tax=Streptomyces sp. NPDC006463 TaxID=3364746 RepID=UPI00367A325C